MILLTTAMNGYSKITRQATCRVLFDFLSSRAMLRRILVVEDDRSMRELVCLHLRSAGYVVAEAEDAIVAGYAVLKAPPDLIVCDIGMPHMDGLEFVAALRADRTVGRIPVIFLTALEDGFERARQLARTEYLMKPLRADVLLAAVAKHLPRHSPFNLATHPA